MTDYVDYYKENGFCVVPQLLDPNEAKAVLDDIHELFYLQLSRFKDVGEKNNNNLYSDMQELLETDTNAYLGAARRASKLLSLHNYMTNAKLAAVTKDLGIELPSLATEQIVHINSDKLVIPGGYYGFASHQDWTSMQGSIDSMVVWAPLVKITEENFPLQVIPGSHKLGLLEADIVSNLVEVKKELYNEDDYISAIVNPGDVAFMSSWTIHRTGIKDCKGLRIACSTRFENAAEKTFVERGYPSAYSRNIERELITPDFPSKDQVLNVFEKLG
jgi:ectoine hydroxylase-related dioxygenase (phytanoyl-CoA dioxygenase family)